MKKFHFFLLLPTLLTACHQPSALQQQAHADFEARKEIVNHAELFSIFDRDLSADERQCMEFLYAYMTWPDMTDYPDSFYLANVQTSLQAREEMSWGATIPEREWMHFVLPIRVNNERMDSSRMVIYNTLKERVADMSMEEAALEVNHWCHEHVTYSPSDARTSAPLATIRSAYGRCGEESTLTVAALRAMGIPARQVYTPRWAHTDDNHAWVEVWVDGKWRFLGACEPEAVLDKGWFNAPASRAILVHTNAFGNYNGPEQVIRRSNCFTEIDVTETYGQTANIIVRVVDAKGKPVPATVEFRLYNYAEFYKLCTRACDSDGISQFHSGCGDLFVWATYKDHFGFAKASVGKEDTLQIALSYDADFEGEFDLDFTPPAEHNITPAETEAQKARNLERLAYEDSLRNAYMQQTFYTEEQAQKAAAELGLDVAKATPLLVATRGNIQTVLAFLRKADNKEKALSLLASLSAKDLRDVPADVLWNHYTQCPAPLFDEGNSPRISNEMLTCWRGQDLTCENITIDDSWNPNRFCMSPVTAAKYGVMDSHSADIYHVAHLRNQGIAARIDEVTGAVQVKNDKGNWVNEKEKAQNGGAQATLCLNNFSDIHTSQIGYYTHFSLSSITDENSLRLLEYPEDESATWPRLFQGGETLQAGRYLMVTGTRLANGGVLAHLSIFRLRADEKRTLPLQIRKSEDKLQVIGHFNAENLFRRADDGQESSILAATGRGFYVLGFLRPNHEPSNHAIRDLAAVKDQLEKWGIPLVLLSSSKEKPIRWSDFPALPSTTIYGYDPDDRLKAEVIKDLQLDATQMPVFVIADTFNRIVWKSQGYTIGLGNQVLKTQSGF